MYGVSIFTHLPEEMQFLWLVEWKRVGEPGETVTYNLDDVGNRDGVDPL